MGMNKGATKDLALWVIRRLRRAGHEALLAGGCVRDVLLGLRPADYDVATSATPQQVRRLFDRVLMVGAQFGVAAVLRRGRTIEVATFRSDVSYSDGRRPDKVVFSSAREDALRRDLTINGMFLDPIAEEVIDYVGGRADLERGIVRAIGRANERFAEDYLRMLRAVRFAARLEFRIAPATARAIRAHAPKIGCISGERVREELTKVFAGPHGAEAMAIAHRLALAPEIFGADITEAAPWTAAMDRLGRVARHRDVPLSLAAIFAEAPAGRVRALTRRWGASNDLRNMLLWLNQKFPLWPSAATCPLPDFKRLMAHAGWDRLRKLWRAEELRLTGRDTAARRVAQRAGRVDPGQVAPASWITGSDLQRMGLTEGPHLGRVLKALYELQLDEQLPDRPAALAKARQLIAG